MRRVLLTASALILISVMSAMWAFRFERSEGIPVCHLSDLRAASSQTAGVGWISKPEGLVLRLALNSGDTPAALRFAIPGMVSVDWLHVRFRTSSTSLSPGPQKWQDGRLLMEWHPPTGPGMELTPLASARGDKRGKLETVVIRAPHGTTTPSLRLEHLGRSGSLELSDLEITAVGERTLWKIGRWFLAAAWLVWATWCIRSWPGISKIRAATAAAIWVLLGVNFVIPGPWKTQRPLVASFQLDQSRPAIPMPAVPAPPHTVSGMEGTLQPTGELPDQENLVLRVKHVAANARPLLHAFLLFGPALVLMGLVGRGPALLLAVIFAISIELAQLAFGYGFDLDDVLDLLNDGTGIALAALAYTRISLFLIRKGFVRYGDGGDVLKFQ